MHMPFWKYGFFIGGGAVFDILKGASVFLIFLAPLVVGAVAGVIASNNAGTVGCWTGGIAAAPLALIAGPGVVQAACDAVSSYAAAHPQTTGAIAGTAAAALTATAEVALAPVTGAVEAFGIMLAIFVGVFGWFLFIMLLLLSGSFNPFENGASHFFIIFGAFAASVTPFVDAFPTFTPALWKVCHDLRKRDAKRRRAWEEKKKAYDQAVAQMRQRRIEDAYATLAARDAEAQTEEQEEAELEAVEEQETVVDQPTLKKSPALVGLPAYG